MSAPSLNTFAKRERWLLLLYVVRRTYFASAAGISYRIERSSATTKYQHLHPLYLYLIQSAPLHTRTQSVPLPSGSWVVNTGNKVCGRGTKTTQRNSTCSRGYHPRELIPDGTIVSNALDALRMIRYCICRRTRVLHVQHLTSSTAAISSKTRQ